jgi:hypothetical protein
MYGVVVATVRVATPAHTGSKSHMRNKAFMSAFVHTKTNQSASFDQVLARSRTKATDTVPG